MAKVSGFYSEHGRLAEDLYHRYAEEQIELLLEFFHRSREFNDRKAGELEAELARRSHGRSRADRG
jgi:hypothetical protein